MCLEKKVNDIVGFTFGNLFLSQYIDDDGLLQYRGVYITFLNA